MKLTDLAESGMSESDGRCIVAPTADFVAPFPSKAAPQRASFGDEVGQRVAELETCSNAVSGQRYKTDPSHWTLSQLSLVAVRHESS